MKIFGKYYIEMKNNIEIEIRSFVSKKQYEKLLIFFKKNSELLKEDNQETIYYDCPQDLRIQKNNFFSKIWLKKGKIHDDSREEIEIHTEIEDFDELKKLFETLGYGIDIKWLRDRKEFKWDNINVCLDYSKGYGYIIELEIMGKKEERDSVLEMLRGKFKELGIEETSKEEFNKEFEKYKKNWRKVIK